MKQFIELTTKEGKVLLNVNHIAKVSVAKEKTIISLSIPDRVSGGSVVVKVEETYSVVVALITSI